MSNSKRLWILACLTSAGLAYSCSDDTSGGSSNSGSCNCTGTQVCVDNKCQDAADPCKSCKSDQVCIGGKCLDPEDSCNPKCTGTKICADGSCVEPGSICTPACTGEKICVNNTCKTPGGNCSPACTGQQKCVDGSCVLVDCDAPCGDICCPNSQQCDQISEICTNTCDDGRATCGSECCPEGSECDTYYGCLSVCTETQTLCKNEDFHSTRCCEAGDVCVDGECRIDCTGEGPRCGDICCASNQECNEEEHCQLICPEATNTRCGTAEQELCCDNATEICLYQKCLPKGESCEKNDDCDFDAYCELTTNTCVANENNPNVCEVRPETGPFAPVVKWWWPKDLPGGKPTVQPEFDQVMNIPAIINLTDDDGNGLINEYDIPDLVFTTFSKTLSGHHYTGDNVLRAISGKDGTELATHPDWFPLANDPGIAKVNNDEYPEIVLSKTIGGVGYTVIMNLVPKADGAGYEFKDVAKLEGGSSFARFANMDGGDFPQIITSAGIIEYTEDAEGNGTYAWRCKGSFGGGNGGYTVADLDGDGEMEIVGQSIFDKNCQLVSDDSISQTGTVLADIDLVDDHENGRLDVEQIAITYGGYGDPSVALPPKGKVHAFKVFKTAEGKFHREQMWETEMPIDYDYAESFMAGYKYSDGTPFKCTRLYHTSFTYGGPAAENAEWYRRYICATGGGPLVVADFDGDKKPDIGLATTWSYAVYNSEGNIIWADFHTQDYSSRATGSSLFDFEGDGVAEVLYADEINLHVYKGPCMGTSDAKFPAYCAATKLIPDIANSSGTLIEYPQVVDVNNDGRSEIVVTSNDYAFRADEHITGIRAFGDPNDRWVRTRRIWNQFDYHVSNINEDGTVPKREKQNWKVKNLNNFRQNVQPGGIFNAPNLVARAVESDDKLCPSNLILNANVENKGALGIPAGLSVKFYAENVNDSGNPGYLGEVRLDKALLPGQSTVASLVWNGTAVVDGETVTVQKPLVVHFVLDEPTDDNPKGEFIECNKTDNQSDSVEIELCKGSVN